MGGGFCGGGGLVGALTGGGPAVVRFVLSLMFSSFMYINEVFFFSEFALFLFLRLLTSHLSMVSSFFRFFCKLAWLAAPFFGLVCSAPLSSKV